MMKNIIHITVLFGLTFLILSCNQEKDRNKEPIQNGNTGSLILLKTRNEVTVQDWLEFHNVAEKDFKPTGDIIERKMKMVEYDLTKEYFDLFSKLFIYSPDSLYFVDLDSYSLVLERDDNGNFISRGGNVDTKVQLINQRNWTSYELMFCGTGCIPEDAIWKDENNLWILGLKYNSEYYPTIWKYIIKENFYQEFTSRKPTKHLASDYTTKIRLKKMAFSIE